ncbi:nuclear transport factor 2 family protein [Bdellovibrio sp. HCB-162]|uniref:nuclear transport factor 2 family protein n=1 Tax=Bdellovibrio sp. HCB-162 TaxID=3394234 RepID=UPI0039BCC10F
MPTNQNANAQNEIAILKEVYAAINRNDIPAVLKLFDPEIERIEPEGFPSSGTYRGLEKIEAHFSQARATWAEGSCEPEQFFVSGDKIVVFVWVHVRLKDNPQWIDAHIADGFTFRNGKVIQMRTFVEKQQALDWAGIN